MITPILLCGGSGTRLWPLSRQSYPKQFAAILGHETLFQASVRRFQGAEFAPPIVVTGDDFRFIVAEQLHDIGVAAAKIVVEPDGRNTAPAALAAALLLAQTDPEELLLLAPSDHAIADPAAFRDAVARGVPAACAGQIVTFGIAPTRPETAYGWLETGAARADGASALMQFIEKPDAARAAVLFADARYLWNAGVFLTRADTLIAAFRTHAASLAVEVDASVAAAQSDLGFLRLDKVAWARAEAISIDYAIMEKATNLSAVRFDGAWSDLGSWDSVWQETPKDARGNGLVGNAIALDCDNTLMRSESDEVELVGIGLNGIVAIAMRDAVMVADLSQSQNVKAAVQVLRSRGSKQATHFPKDHRPWGWFETLVLADRFQVKRIHVHPGEALSLQSHLHRSEHWIVVAGTARVTVNGHVSILSENQSVYIPLGAQHRLENPGKVAMVLIEVQTGHYLGEDDITRYDDKYGDRR